MCALHDTASNPSPSHVAEALNLLRDQDNSHHADLHLAGLYDGSELDFSGITFENATLDDANLETATFDDTTFNFSSFRNADLTDATCTDATFENCDMTGAILNKANFGTRNTTLSDSQLTATSCTRTRFQRAELQRVDFSDARITHAHLQGADLQGSDFIDATIKHTDLPWSECTNADFTDARIEGCDCRAIDATSATFVNATIRDTQFTDAHLADISMTGATLANDVEFGHRLLSEHYADYLTSTAATRDNDNIPAPEHPGFKRYGQDGMKAALDTTWWDAEDPVEKAPADSDIDQFYSVDTPIPLISWLRSPPGRFERQTYRQRIRLAVSSWLVNKARRCTPITNHRTTGENPPRDDEDTADRTEDSDSDHLESEGSPSIRQRVTQKLANNLNEKYESPSIDGIDDRGADPLPAGQSTGEDQPEWVLPTNPERRLRAARSKLQEAEQIYSEITAAYRNGPWDEARRQMNYRRQEVRRKQLHPVEYVRQWFLKWTMGYGERPIAVLKASALLIGFGVFLYPICGVQFGGTEVHYTWTPKSIGGTLFSTSAVTGFAVQTFLNVGGGDVHALGWGQAYSTLLSVAGKLFFAIFVYTLGRRAVT